MNDMLATYPPEGISISVFDGLNSGTASLEGDIVNFSGWYKIAR